MSLNDFTIKQLFELAEYFSISKRGNKKTLVARLKREGITYDDGIKYGLKNKQERRLLGKYPETAKKDFCGAAGGASPRSYPVDTDKHCQAALAYARAAPYPDGIRGCALKKAKERGYVCGVSYSPEKKKMLIENYVNKKKLYANIAMAKGVTKVELVRYDIKNRKIASPKVSRRKN